MVAPSSAARIFSRAAPIRISELALFRVVVRAAARNRRPCPRRPQSELSAARSHDRLDHRTDVGALGIVDVSDAAFVRAQIRFDAAARETCERPLDRFTGRFPSRALPPPPPSHWRVVPAGQLETFEAIRPRVAANVEDYRIALGPQRTARRRIGDESETEHPRAHVPGELPDVRVVAIENRPIGGILIFEQARFSVAVFVEIAIAIEVIVGKIEMDADVRLNFLDQFELIARHLDHRDFDSRPRRLDQRRAEIAADESVRSPAVLQISPSITITVLLPLVPVTATIGALINGCRVRAR